jgi:hypothetical protein
MANPLVRALIAHFDSVFEGPNGDYPAVLEALAGVSAAQALWKPVPTQNSIWQIVEHLTASKVWQIEMLKHGQAAPPMWIEPAGDGAEWQAALTHLKQAHLRLKFTLEQMADADLLKVPAGESLTQLQLLLSSGPTHEAHHGGQIDYLKGLQTG